MRSTALGTHTPHACQQPGALLQEAAAKAAAEEQERQQAAEAAAAERRRLAADETATIERLLKRYVTRVSGSVTVATAPEGTRTEGGAALPAGVVATVQAGSLLAGDIAPVERAATDTAELRVRDVEGWSLCAARVPSARGARRGRVVHRGKRTRARARLIEWRRLPDLHACVCASTHARRPA